MRVTTLVIMTSIRGLEPATNNTGFVGTIAFDDGSEKRFAVLLAEDVSAAERARIVGAAHEQLRALVSSPGIVARTSSAIRNALRLKKVFRRPHDIVLRSTKHIEKALKKGIDAPGDCFTIACKTRAVYAVLCTAIGITRTDHLVNAELSSLINDSGTQKTRVLGHAHKLRDALRKGLKRCGASLEGHYLTELTAEIVKSIPKAAKFYVGSYGFDKGVAIDASTPDAYRLPYKTCLLEVAVSPEQGSYGRIFFYCRQMDDDVYEFHAIFSRTSRPSFFRCGFVWDVSKDAMMNTTLIPYDENPAELRQELDHDQHFGNAVADLYRLPVCALGLLNNPSVGLTLHEAPKLRLPSTGKFRRSPYYDCYELNISSDKAPRKIGGALSSGRVVRAHERRGHFREYKHERYVNMRGKSIWIDDMHVGDPKNGVVSKGYRLSSLTKLIPGLQS